MNGKLALSRLVSLVIPWSASSLRDHITEKKRPGGLDILCISSMTEKRPHVAYVLAALIMPTASSY